MKPLKATREQLKRHNRQLLLRAIYYGMADNRAALAQETGLAKPTVSDLVTELIEEGLLVEGGRGESTDSGGKRPTLIKFVPDARQVIGVSLDTTRAYGILSNLAGQVVARHYADLETLQGEEVVTLLEEVINGLIAQLDSELLCIGIGVPGVVDTELGIVRQSEYLGWSNLRLSSILQTRYNIPVHIGNNTELTAIAQFAFGTDGNPQAHNLVTVLVNNSVEVGVAWDNATYHHGGDIGSLRLFENQRLDSLLGWDYVRQRSENLKQAFPDSILPEHDLTYLHIKHALANQDPVAETLTDELSTYLAYVMAWTTSLLHPNHISLVGAIVNLGELFLDNVVQKTERLLSPSLVGAVTFSLGYSPNMSAIGAAAHAIQKELDLI